MVVHTKYNSNGAIEQYKTCLVDKGFTQREDIDYNETFTLVLELATL